MRFLYCHSVASHCVSCDGHCCVQSQGVCAGGSNPQHSLFCSVFLEEPFCCFRFSVCCSLSKALQPLLPVKKINTEFQCRIPGGQEGPFSEITEQSVLSLQLCLSVLRASSGFLNCSSFSPLPHPGAWEPPLCLQVSVSSSTMEAGSRIHCCRCVPGCICGAAAEQAPAGAWWGCHNSMCVFVDASWVFGQDMQQDLPVQNTHTCIGVEEKLCIVVCTVLP